LKLFKLFSSQPGKVLSSGHAVSYLQEKEVIETQWLNGLSMWRVRFARHYGKNLPSTPYAACEDLIFSYPLSKVGTLLYVPEARAAFQSHEKSKFDSIEVLRAASLWRYYFVTHNNELSFKWFYFSQIPRSIFAIRKTKDGKTRLFFGLITLNLKILYNYIRKGSPVILLNELRN
jgi:hypothetical protein